MRNSSLPGDLKSGKAGYKDDLPTYSLDYEKHVQEKIEEHRKLVQTKRYAKYPSFTHVLHLDNRQSIERLIKFLRKTSYPIIVVHKTYA